MGKRIFGIFFSQIHRYLPRQSNFTFTSFGLQQLYVHIVIIANFLLNKFYGNLFLLQLNTGSQYTLGHLHRYFFFQDNRASHQRNNDTLQLPNAIRYIPSYEIHDIGGNHDSVFFQLVQQNIFP